ncbi:ATP-binding protein [Microbulbifer sp. SSSA007]|uniref:ATP-binding protein n=1 Tax=Microbulbifer sp. SSSA007 TaxID=3243379 RepID=UPI004039A8BC
MSFAKKIKLHKSSSFRLAIITFSCVCLSSSISLASIYLITKQSLANPTFHKIENITKESIAEINDLEFFHPDIFPNFKNVKPRNFINNHTSPSKFTSDYTHYFKNLLNKSSFSNQEELAIQGRLFALGENINPPLEKIPANLIWHLLNSEFPEDFHDYVDNITDERFSHWPQYHKKRHIDATLLAKYYIETEYFLDTEDLCVKLQDAKGNIILSNIEGISPQSTNYKSTYTATYNPDSTFGQEDEQHICLARTSLLSDGGELILGKDFTQQYHLLKSLNSVIFYGLLITAIISLICGYLVSRQAVRRISEINKVCRQIMSGDLDKRIPYNSNGGDYDQLSIHINTMLDKIQQLMMGIKQVSDNIAHDLKSPLSRLRGQLELLLHIEKPDKDTIEAIINENDRIIECFNALLRISQIEQGAQRSAFRHFSLHNLLKTLVEVYEPIFHDQGILPSVTLIDDQHMIFGDKNQWSQSIANLFDNIIKYAPGSGKLDIRLSAQPQQGREYLQLQLHDSGPGIPEDDHKKVFERFYRLESHRHTKGNGLGLSLVLAVCNLHKAKIHLANCNGLKIQIDIPSITDPHPAHSLNSQESKFSELY